MSQTLQEIALSSGPKDKSPKQAVHYQSRIVHEVYPIQRELKATLKTLEQTTGDRIDYISVGRLGVTLATLDPLVKPILGLDKKGVIEKSAISDFEDELNTELEELHDRKVHIADISHPLELYGKHKDKLALRLSKFEGLTEERIEVEKYLREQEPNASSRFFNELMGWEPHIVIGIVKPEKFDVDNMDSFLDNPSSYLDNLVSEVHLRDREVFGIEPKNDAIIFPEEISLGALRVVCDRQAERVF